MLNCRSCGHMVAPSAIICPNCGATHPGGLMRSFMKGILSLVIFIAVIAVAIMALNG